MKAIKKWKVEYVASGKTLTEVEIQKGIFQGDVLSPLLFVIVMMPRNHILRKCSGATNLLNHKMDDIKLFAKNEKELETLICNIRIYSQDKGMEFGVENVQNS